MEQKFEEYLKQARWDFAKVAEKYPVEKHLELRTAIDSLLIAYDQAVHQALSLGVVVKSLPNDDEIEKAANEEASRIFDGTGSGSEWYARHHGFTDGVEWLKNHLAK
jgi:allophanate hydrolase subunit 1